MLEVTPLMDSTITTGWLNLVAFLIHTHYCDGSEIRIIRLKLDMLERSLAPMQAHPYETIIAYLLMLDTCILMLANLKS